MEIKGYKAFDNGLINRYGRKFEIDETYTTTGDISFGNNGKGYHFCKNIEDTLRYFDAKTKDIVIAEVTGSEEIVTFNDEYNGYYDMYSARTIKIDRIIDREELIEMFLTKITSELRVMRFIQLYKLTSLEIERFKTRYHKSINILNTISYYQESKLDTYKNQDKIYKK